MVHRLHPDDRETAARLDLTAAQRGIWYAQQLAPANPTYQISQYLELDGEVDLRLLQIAWTKTVRDVDALCLRFHEDAHGPYATMHRPEPTEELLTVVDLRSADSVEEADHSARRRMDAEMEQVRELSSADLCDTIVFLMPGNRTLLFQRVHHIMLDGYSAVVILHYLARVYSELTKRIPQALAKGLAVGPLARGVAATAAKKASPFPGHQDLLDDLEEYRHSTQYIEDQAFWGQEIQREADVVGLEGTPQGPAENVVRASVTLTDEDARPLRELDRHVPRFMVAAVAAYMSRITGQEHISVGLPVTARRGRVAKSAPSMLSNILPLRLQISPGTEVADAISRAGDRVRDVVRHQRFRLEDLQGAPTMVGPSVNLLPVVDDLRFGTVTGRVHILSTGPVHDLSITLSGLDSQAADPTVQLEGDAELHSVRTLQEHGQRILRFAADLLQAEPGTTIDQVRLTAPQEEAELLSQGSGPRRPLQPETVLESFAAAARTHPDEPAVVAQDGTLTFAQLQADSTRLAHHLRHRGAGSGQSVAVRIERSVNLPLLVLAVLKSGGAYVPLDPEYPVDRVAGMIDDAEPALLLTSQSQAAADRAAGASWDLPTMAVDADTEQSWHRCTDDPGLLPGSAPHDLAYVIFTSGSTGRPKGVGVERLALRNLYQEHQDQLFGPTRRRLGRRARVALTAGLSFDAAWDPLLWLFDGNELHIVDDERRRDPQRLAEMLSDQQIDSLETTPSFAEALLSTGVLSSEGAFAQRHRPSVVAVGGEDVDPDLWDRLSALPGVTAVNLYGPTETTVDSLVAPITKDAAPHIGSSVGNSRHYVLDSSLQPIPDRAVGELYLAGTNLARGYIGQPAMSSANFIADPFAGDGSRMYRTGDVVSRRSDGTLQFMGRMDDQVKIRGYRVELGEVEAALRRLPGIDQAAALVHGDGPAARLSGYVAYPASYQHSQRADGRSLRDQLKGQLPDYMVPSTIMVLDAFPLTTNGKLDRGALPEPRSAAAVPAQRPRTAAQRRVADAFAEVLGLDAATIGVDEDFFAAGGHSLLATELAATLSADPEERLSVRDVFEASTVSALADRLQRGEASVGGVSLTRMDHPEVVPASLTQRRLWFLNQMEPESAAYNIPVVLHLRGRVDTKALKQAFMDVAGRHEPLRTILPMVEGEPIQKTLSTDAVGSGFTAVTVPEHRLPHVIEHEAHKPFDITTEVPLRGVLLSTSEQEHTLVVVMHHIASDGWSLAPFARDISTAYSARTRGASPELAEPAVRYSDFSLWQREHLGDPQDPDSEAFQQAEFWRQELAGAPTEISLPRDYPRTNSPSNVSELHTELGSQDHQALRELAASRRASLFMVLQAGLTVALKQQGAGEDVVIGTPVAGRDDPQLQELVGFFVNTLVLRTSLAQDPELGEVVDRVRETNTAAYAHQELPFDSVVDAVSPPRTAQMHPIFQTMLTLQNTEPAAVELDEVDITVPAQMTSAGVKTDVMFDVEAPQADSGPLTVTLAYDQGLFEAETADRILAAFIGVLRKMTQDPRQRVSQLPVADPETLQWLEDQSTGPHLLSQGTIVDALEATAQRHPTSPAVVDADGRLNFQQLREAAENGAANLRASGVRRGDRVLIALPRGTGALASILAVLRAGAVATPVDLAYPAARIGQIVGASAPVIAIVDDASAHAADGDAEELRRAIVDSAPAVHLLSSDKLLGESHGGLPEPPDPDDVAYLVHTSGTTGTPKGVQVPHKALQNVLTHHREHLIGPRQQACAPELPTMLHLTGLGFDAAWDPILWLVAGTTVLIPDETQRVDAEAVVGLLSAEGGADVVETTPSYAQQLLSVGLISARRGSDRPLILAMGGEAVTTQLWQSVASADELEGWNLYGPSEFTVDSVTAPVVGPTPHIGGPISNVAARVLDSDLSVVPPGVEGELYLSGASEAHGYRGRTAETAANFVADPWSPGQRMYRTGDVVRRRADGALEFLRRDDDQVKIRGYRIEIAEVESVLSALEAVQSAVVRVSTPGSAETAQLVAWLVTERPMDQIRAEAAGLLPDYMIPIRMQAISTVPLTSHGKVDTDALPEPEAERGSAQPQTQQEKTVCAVMGDVLGISDVTLDDDFFALGGHSLLAVSLVGRLQQEAGLTVPLRAVFEATTPARLLALGRGPGHADDTEADDTEADDTAPSSHQRGVSSAQAPSAAALPLKQWVTQHPRDLRQELPLTAGQQRLWFLNQLDPESPEYNVVIHVELTGDLDPTAMSGAIDDLVARHEVLRTTYPASSQEDPSSRHTPVQQVHPARAGTLRDAPVDPSAGFDLTREVPLRAGLVELGDRRWRLELVIHHIATDGASLQPLAREVSAAYTARVSGGAALQRPMEAQFADVARREQHARGDLADQGIEQDPALDRWAQQLDAVPDELQLPADGARKSSASQPAGMLRFEIPAETAAQVGRVASAQSATGFHGWLAGLAGYLRRIGAGSDIVIGSPSAGRSDPDLEELIGFFVNTLPLRVQCSEESLSYSDVVSIARRVTLSALEDEHVPFEQIVERMAPQRQLGRHPLFQTMLSVEEPTDLAMELPGVRATPLEPGSTGSAKVDLSFTLRPRAGSEAAVDAVLEYNAAMFTEAVAHRVANQWVQFLHEATSRPEQPVLSAPLTGSSSGLDSWPPVGPQNESVLSVLSDTVQERPHETALVAGTDSLTYRQLATRIIQLSAGLSSQGIGRGDVVAVCLPRSVDTAVSLLAVWHLGAVAMPVDTSLPPQRVASMFATSNPQVVLHDGGPQTSAAAGSAQALVLAALESAEEVSSDAASWKVTGLDAVLDAGRADFSTEGGRGQHLSEASAPQDPAYLVFTSGTTGAPKGVQVPYQALTQLLASHRSTLMPEAQRRRHRLAHTTGVGFDAAMDPILWLVAGHEVHIIDEDVRRDPQALVHYFGVEDITAWEATPSYVDAVVAHADFADHVNSHSKDAAFVLLLGGEPVDQDLWEWSRSQDGLHTWNLYGPTEAGVDSLVGELMADRRPELGAPTVSTQAYVLDDRLRPVPDGSVGELWLAGGQLAHGYDGQRAETAQKFVPDPFAGGGQRMYRTGDLAVVQPAADDPRPRVRILGRADDQVKIRGYRVELSEVEAVLRGHHDVAQAVVRVRSSRSGDELAAWLVPASQGGSESDQSEKAVQLLKYAQQQLPSYMVPKSLTFVEQIPLTANGKVDEQALPLPQASPAGAAGRPPSTDPEKAIAAAFAEILKVEGVRAEDSFFELGGHSFLVQPVISAVNEQLSTDLPVQAIFQAPTVEGLGALVDSDGADVAESMRPILGLKPHGRGKPIFALHSGSGLSWQFSSLVTHLQTDRPVLGVQMHGLDPGAAAVEEPESMAQLVSWYVDTVQEEQPEGPYHLIGWSLGGRLAHFIAAELRARGFEVATLAVLDAYPSQFSTEGITDEQSAIRAFLTAQGADSGADEQLSARSVQERLREASSPLATVPQESIRRAVRRFQSIAQLVDRTEPPVFDGDLQLFEATQQVPETRPAPQAWSTYVRGALNVHQVAATHYQMLQPETIRVLGRSLPRLRSEPSPERS